MSYITKRENILSLLRRIQKNNKLLAPIKTPQGDITFGPVTDVKEVDLEAGRPIISAKSSFFPQEETMFTHLGTSHDGIQETVFAEPAVYYGVKACDLKAINIVDTFLGDFGYPDPYYFPKRENSTIIVLSCNYPDEGCFCNSTGSGPFAEKGYDLQMTDLGGKYYVTVGSEKGQELVNKFTMFFTEATTNDDEELYNHEAEVLARFGPKIDVSGAYQAIKESDDAQWVKISSRCLSCGGCSFVCPTCTCYNVTDRMNTHTLAGSRNRVWDSCVLEGFTRMAGRHNLEKDKATRIKKRFLHKLVYNVDRYGEIACVGCGRCTVTCLGDIDMVKVVKEVISP